ncbi:rhodanese-like domain-containing protein [Candidatus Dependentiae bacterium]
MVFKRSFVFVCIGALLVVLSSCWKDKEVKTVGKMKGLVVVNVLNKSVFDDCHIKGSIHIPFTKVKEDAPKMIDKDAEVVLYCSNYMCSASGAARKQLIGLGYKNVFVYEGGTAQWLQKGYPVNGSCKKTYLKVKIPKPPHAQQDYMLTADQLKKKLEQSKKI